MTGYLFDLPREYLKSALLVSLLSVWVLVAVFAYLNFYTRRRYFTIWSGAWMFYGLWLTLSLSWYEGGGGPALPMAKQACAGFAAMGMIWGACLFLQQPVSARLFGLFSIFLLLWSYAGAYSSKDLFWMQVPVFGLMGLASSLMALGFWRSLRQRHSMGATLLSLGFLLWGGYLAGHPLWECSEPMIATGFFISAVLQLFISVSMIILVLEEVRITNHLALRQVEERTSEAEGLRSQVVSTEERYQSLFSRASEAIIVTRASDLRMLELNGAAHRLLGLSPEDRGCHCLSAFLRPRTGSEAIAATGQEWFSQLRQNQVLDLVRCDGSKVSVEVAGAPVPYEGQTAYQFFFREVTEKLRLEQQLRQTEKLAALGRMISGVAHELNNPLAVVKGYLDLILSNHQLGKQTRADLEKVAHESDRAARLVGHFLSFAREAPAQRGPVEINRIVRAVVELREMEFRSAGVQTMLDLEPGLPETEADAGQLEQVLVNLLSNALHVLTEWPSSRRLKITTRREGAAIMIRVEDSGPGISPEVLPHIFEPFYTTKQVGSGTGLGLSIAHGILAEHNGRIYHEPSSEGGAGFVLELPVVKTEEAVSEDSGRQSAEACPADPLAAISEPAARILIVDDEPALAELLAELLSTLGHLPATCCSALEALELVEQQPFDLILSDFRMPRMDGQQFYQRLCQIQPALARRVVFVTGDLVSERTRTFLNSVGNPHLSKPFRLAAISKVLAEVLDRDEPWPQRSHAGAPDSEPGSVPREPVFGQRQYPDSLIDSYCRFDRVEFSETKTSSAGSV